MSNTDWQLEACSSPGQAGAPKRPLPSPAASPEFCQSQDGRIAQRERGALLRRARKNYLAGLRQPRALVDNSLAISARAPALFRLRTPSVAIFLGLG
jgi:hypothetical protein